MGTMRTGETMILAPSAPSSRHLHASRHRQLSALRHPRLRGFVASWFKRWSLVICLVCLASCGFRPLYADRGGGGGTADPVLASISVEPIADRIGQILATYLRDGFNPTGTAVVPRYTLIVRVTTARRDIGIRKDATATRTQVDVVASYVLVRASDHASLFTATSRATDAFDVIDNDYATTVAETTAQQRVMRVIGIEIQTRVALYLQNNPA
jgi:LPS-assembly lipoprotein